MMIFYILLLSALLLAIYSWYSRPRGSPPGPRGVPFIGIIPYLDKYPERVLAKWSKQYGPVMSISMGTQHWVVLNDYDSVNQALVKNGSAFSGRPVTSISLIQQGHGIALADYGDIWKRQRKFGSVTLRGFGVGKQSIEEKILEEVEYLIAEISSKQGKPFEIKNMLMNSVSNVINSIVFGHRFAYDDPEFVQLILILKTWFGDEKRNAMLGLLTLAPWLRYFPPFASFYKDFETSFKEQLEIIEKEINDHENNFQTNDVRDFIDAFLVEMKQEKKTFTKFQLLFFVSDLFNAGTETISSTILWSILCLIHYPEIQKKLHQEIKENLGQDGRPTMSLKANMPYCSAFIDEITRYRTTIPLSVLHKTSEDVLLNGYRIPKETTIAPNIWAVHNDPDLWPQPNKFDPERHLDEEGNYVKSNYIIPFSIGPRSCLGEQLAKTELFLLLVSLVQKFEFHPNSDEDEMPDIENGSNGFLFVPSAFTLIARERSAF